MATDISKTVEDLEAAVDQAEALVKSKDEQIQVLTAQVADLQGKLQESSTYVTDELAGKLSGAVAKLQQLLG